MTARKIEVLGPGCKKCANLYEAARKAVAETGAQAEVSKVEGLDEIIAMGVMITPALVIDGVVKSSGRVLSAREIAELLAEEN